MLIVEIGSSCRCKIEYVTMGANHENDIFAGPTIWDPIPSGNPEAGKKPQDALVPKVNTQAPSPDCDIFFAPLDDEQVKKKFKKVKYRAREVGAWLPKLRKSS